MYVPKNVLFEIVHSGESTKIANTLLKALKCFICGACFTQKQNMIHHLKAVNDGKKSIKNSLIQAMFGLKVNIKSILRLSFLETFDKGHSQTTLTTYPLH